MKFFPKRRITVLAVLLVALIAAIGGWAYFTANGTGSGTATVGTSATLTLHGTAGTTLYPGTTSSITFTVDNPSAGGTEATGCESVETGASDGNTANFWMADVAENQDIAGGASGTAATNAGTL